jgi:subtilisin family serine protease
VDSEGQSVADESIIARAIEHATTKEKVDIINLSLGTRAVNHSYKMPILHEAIKKATKAGILVVCAAGNSDNSGIVYPAAFEECISVGNVAYDI